MHRVQGLVTPPVAFDRPTSLYGRRPNLATQTIGGVDTYMVGIAPSYDNYVDISALSFCDMETSLILGQHIDAGFFAHSKKRELIFRIILRLKRMRDKELCYNGGGGEEDRLWTSGKYLIEVMRVKFEEGGSMGMGKWSR